MSSSRGIGRRREALILSAVIGGALVYYCGCHAGLGGTDPGTVPLKTGSLPAPPSAETGTHSAGSAPGTTGSVGSSGSGGRGQCNDGVDNDGDGLMDWQLDPGCYGPGDRTETSGKRAQEGGFSTWEFPPTSRVIYVSSSSGQDSAPGTSPSTPVRTLNRAAELVRDGSHDFIRLRRGDRWRGETLGRFKSGRDAEHPLVVGSYGNSLELPLIEVDDLLIDHRSAERSFVALIDLHLVAYRKRPGDPDFSGSGAGGLRYVGGGEGLLIEGCHFEYGGLVLQSNRGLIYRNVQLRRNVFEKVYHAGTCREGDPRGSAKFRPSGVFAKHVEGLLVEENFFDHNGWNEDVPSACATIYNHNAYLNGSRLVVRGNVMTRSSSIHLKLRSDVQNDMHDISIQENFFVQGEVGVSIGGNTDEPGRFVNARIARNVFFDIGATRPTGRTLAWGIQVNDNRNLAVEENLFANQTAPGVKKSFAVQVGGGSEEGVRVSRNTFYRIQSTALFIKSTVGHEEVEISENTFFDPDQGSCLVDFRGASAAGYQFTHNRYYSSAPETGWFCYQNARHSLADWVRWRQEEESVQLAKGSDPLLDHPLGAGNAVQFPLAARIGLWRSQTRLNWDETATGTAEVNRFLAAISEQ